MHLRYLFSLRKESVSTHVLVTATLSSQFSDIIRCILLKFLLHSVVDWGFNLHNSTHFNTASFLITYILFSIKHVSLCSGLNRGCILKPQHYYYSKTKTSFNQIIFFLTKLIPPPPKKKIHQLPHVKIKTHIVAKFLEDLILGLKMWPLYFHWNLNKTR